MASYRKDKLSDLIKNDIMDRILSGEFKDREYLPTEGELCEIFEVSRATVREAIRGLQEMGFVERQQGIGIKIINKSIEVVSKSLHTMMLRTDADKKAILEVRKIIELQASRMAAERADPEDIEEMKKTIEIMRNAKASISEYAENDLMFHILLAKASKNKILESIMMALTPLVKEIIIITLESTNFRPELKMSFHEKVLKTIIQRNPDEAEKCMRIHLEATEKMTYKLDSK